MKVFLFDLDGTLLPMDVKEFVRDFTVSLIRFIDKHSYNGKELMNCVLVSLQALSKNDGTHTNEYVFWETFEKASSLKRETLESLFYDYYENCFDELDTHIQNKNMIESIQILKDKGYDLYLTTNPLFPSIATYKRIKWAGLDPHDFKFITTYENSSYTKPNIEYYKEVIHHFNLNKDDCMMVGNDVIEDGAIEKIGIPVYIIDDYIINKENKEVKLHGSSKDFLEFVKNL